MKQLNDIRLRSVERKAINAFSRRLKRSLGTQLVSVLLFGSKARGDFRKSSDIDLFVLLKKKTPREYDVIVQTIVDIEEELGVVLSPVVYSLYEQERNLAMHSFFFEAVQSEGIPI